MPDAWRGTDAYERFMGRWSRALARELVAWAPVGAERARVLDLGCGTGALAAALLDADPSRRVVGVDPSADFAAGAQENGADVARADATALPFGDASFDAVASSLVLNFVPDPARAAREMARVLRPGGVAAACVWDYGGGMEMLRRFWDAAIEQDPERAAAADEARRFPLCRQGALPRLLEEAGFRDVAHAPLVVAATFPSFDDYWAPFENGPGPAPGYVAALGPERRADLRERVRRRLSSMPDGSIRLPLRAWAARGVRPA